MFGPNTYFRDFVDINYSHRDKRFFDLLNKVRQKFCDIFNLQDYDILFIPGSATIGIESVMYSYNGNIKVIGPEGTFTTRWTQMAENYKQNNGKEEELFCLLETSGSKYFSKEGCFVDAVSAFPYYNIPKGTKCFVTCLNKQLGSYIGVAIVGVRKDCWHLFKDSSVISYLNLARYKEAHDNNQTPSTFPTYALEHLNYVLDTFNLEYFRTRLDVISDVIVETIGEQNIIGETKGPVITVPKHCIPKNIAAKYELYGYYCDRPNYQFFTYTDYVHKYEQCMQEIARSK